jgi:amidase
MTGPVGIAGAEPGDALAVEILSIEVDPVGYVGVFPEVGIVRDVVNERVVTMLPVKDGQVHFKDLRLPLKPMIGAMACAPLEPISVGLIGRHGGNMDNNRLAVGTTVHLPIFAPMGLFYVGDVHATMGDAEMCGSGAEIGARVHLRFRLEKGGATDWPWMETPDRWITTASAPSFEEAAEFCTRSMIALLGQRLGVSPADAFGLMSIAADLRINQYCKAPKLGTSIRCEFPKLGAGIARA